MIIVVNKNADETDVSRIKERIVSFGCEIHESRGDNYRLIGVVGDTSHIDEGAFETNSYIDRVIHVQEPYKKANRLFHPDNSIIKVCDKAIGGDKIAVIAGPCSVESGEQIIDIAKSIKESGASFLRGGAYKPRTSPYSFQGLQLEGLELLKKAKKVTGLPIVTEIMSERLIDKFVEDVDIIQVGARNMQNFNLLRELGKTNKPILLKRGLSSTIEEFLMSAEYIMAGGNENVILCERGIRTFEHYTRNTLDLSAVPVIKKLSHLPIIIDPSHATGHWWMVEPLSKAAVAVGADGLIIEVHNNPEKALCDGAQSIKPERFSNLINDLKAISAINNRSI